MTQVSEMTQRIVEGKAKLWPLRTVAAKLKVSVSTLTRWISVGEFPKPDYQIGRVRKWSSDTVRHWVVGQQLKAMGFSEVKHQQAILVAELKAQPLHAPISNVPILEAPKEHTLELKGTYSTYRIIDVESGRPGGNVLLTLDGHPDVLIHESQFGTDVGPGDWYLDEARVVVTNDLLQALSLQPTKG